MEKSSLFKNLAITGASGLIFGLGFSLGVAFAGGFYPDDKFTSTEPIETPLVIIESVDETDDNETDDNNGNNVKTVPEPSTIFGLILVIGLIGSAKQVGVEPR